MSDAEADIEAKSRYGAETIAVSRPFPFASSGKAFKIVRGHEILGASSVSWEEAFARAVANG